MKICTKCKQERSFDLFRIKKNGNLDSWCKECYRNLSKTYYNQNKNKVAVYKQTEKFKQLKSQWDLTYRQRNAEKLKEKKKAYYLKNRDKHLVTMRENYAKKQDEYKARALQWKKINRAKHNATCMERYTAKMQSRLSWAQELTELACKEAYDKADHLFKITGILHDVDHIVPLKGKTVCGLHIYSNLQVISASQNRSKKHLYWPDQW